MNAEQKRQLDKAARESIERKIEAARNHLRRMLVARVIIEGQCAPPIYRCTACLENFVTPEDGQDTCEKCIASQ